MRASSSSRTATGESLISLPDTVPQLTLTQPKLLPPSAFLIRPSQAELTSTGPLSCKLMRPVRPDPAWKYWWRMRRIRRYQKKRVTEVRQPPDCSKKTSKHNLMQPWQCKIIPAIQNQIKVSILDYSLSLSNACSPLVTYRISMRKRDPSASNPRLMSKSRSECLSGQSIQASNQPSKSTQRAKIIIQKRFWWASLVANLSRPPRCCLMGHFPTNCSSHWACPQSIGRNSRSSSEARASSYCARGPSSTTWRGRYHALLEAHQFRNSYQHSQWPRIIVVYSTNHCRLHLELCLRWELSSHSTPKEAQPECLSCASTGERSLNVAPVLLESPPSQRDYSRSRAPVTTLKGFFVSSWWTDLRLADHSKLWHNHACLCSQWLERLAGKDKVVAAPRTWVAHGSHRRRARYVPAVKVSDPKNVLLNLQQTSSANVILHHVDRACAHLSISPSKTHNTDMTHMARWMLKWPLNFVL